MQISILTLFPEMFFSPFGYSIIKRALDRHLLKLNLVNLRDFGLGAYKAVDDRPYGGGVGMIMRVDVIANAIISAKCPSARAQGEGKVPFGPSSGRGQSAKLRGKIVLLDPKGKLFNQQMARRFSKLDYLILVCGHYEGVDERVKKLVDETISIGDYVLTGGEIPAMVLVDSISRLLPGVLSKKEATRDESFSQAGTWEYPQYTRPPTYKNLKVPKILLSGDHQKIIKWRKLRQKTT